MMTKNKEDYVFPGKYAPGMSGSHGCTRGMNHVHRVFHASTAGLDTPDGCEWVHICVTTGTQKATPTRNLSMICEDWCVN